MMLWVIADGFAEPAPMSVGDEPFRIPRKLDERESKTTLTYL